MFEAQFGGDGEEGTCTSVVQPSPKRYKGSCSGSLTLSIDLYPPFLKQFKAGPVLFLDLKLFLPISSQVIIRRHMSLFIEHW